MWYEAMVTQILSKSMIYLFITFVLMDFMRACEVESKYYYIP
jgi:hypothetical protein